MSSYFSALTAIANYNIAENSAATPGLWNQAYAATDRDFSMLWSGASQGLSDLSSFAHGLVLVGGSGISGFINSGATPYNANPDGATDSASAFTTVDSAATRGWIVIPPGAYKVNSTITLVGTYLRCPGAYFKPASGVTIYLTGDWLQSDDTLVDPTLGGNVYWLVKRPSRPQYWGVRGNYTPDLPALAVDDAAAWNAAIRAMPDHSVIDSTGVHSAISSTVTIANREDLYIGAKHWPIQNTNGGAYCASFTWSGATSATSDHGMVRWDRCRHCVIEGTAFWANGKANVAVSTDSIDGLGHGSSNKLSNCIFTNGGENPQFVGFDIGRTSLGNQEFHEVRGCVFVGGLHDGRGALINASNGSSHFTVSPGYQIASDVSGFQILWYNGTSRSTSTLISVISTSYGIIQDTFGSNISNAQCVIVSRTGGVGVRMGLSADIDNIKISDTNFNLCEWGVEINNGNLFLDECSFGGSAIDINSPTGNGNVIEQKTRVEQSRQHAVGVNLGYKLTDSSFGLNLVIPGGGWIEPHSGGKNIYENNSFEGVVPPGSRIYNRDSHTGQTVWINNTYDPSTTTTTSGHMVTGANHIGCLAFGEDAVTGAVLWTFGSLTTTEVGQPLSLKTRLFSSRTLAASALTASAGNTNLLPNEIGFTVGGASGASLYIHSAGTVWIFNSAISAKAT